MPERRFGVVEREPWFATRVTARESRPLVQRRSDSPQVLTREPRGNGPQHSVAKARLSDAAGVSISSIPRRSEKLNIAAFTQVEKLSFTKNEKEQLFRDFSEWLKQRRETP